MTNDFNAAKRYESFRAASDDAALFVSGPDFFDTVQITIQCQGDHWTVMIQEPGNWPKRWFA